MDCFYFNAIKIHFGQVNFRIKGCLNYFLVLSIIIKMSVPNTRVLQKVLTLGSDYFSATFYQTYFYYNLQSIPPFTETHFCNLSREKQINSLLLVSVGDTDK